MKIQKQRVRDAESLVEHEIENFEFLLGMVIGYNILAAINGVSKLLQTQDMQIDVAIEQLKGLISFLKTKEKLDSNLL